MGGPPRARSAPRPIQVFLVAEHAGLRLNLGLLLEGEGMAVAGWAASAAAAGTVPAGTDVVVVGLSAARRGALELVREMAARPDAPPIVVLSANDDDDSIGEALAAGARGYVSNREAAGALAHAIRAAFAGHIETHPLPVAT